MARSRHRPGSSPGEETSKDDGLGHPSGNYRISCGRFVRAMRAGGSPGAHVVITPTRYCSSSPWSSLSSPWSSSCAWAVANPNAGRMLPNIGVTDRARNRINSSFFMVTSTYPEGYGVVIRASVAIHARLAVARNARRCERRRLRKPGAGYMPDDQGTKSLRDRDRDVRLEFQGGTTSRMKRT